jgi:WD40 repeat protein
LPCYIINGESALFFWHPATENILLTAGINTNKSTFVLMKRVDHYFPSTGSDNLVVIWNAGTGEPTVVIDSHPDLVYSACLNWDGSKLLTTCKDKKIRIINPRSGVVEEVVALERCEKQQSTNTFFIHLFRRLFAMKDRKPLGQFS